MGIPLVLFPLSALITYTPLCVVLRALAYGIVKNQPPTAEWRDRRFDPGPVLPGLRVLSAGRGQSGTERSAGRRFSL